jgi:hypothetical protein
MFNSKLLEDPKIYFKAKAMTERDLIAYNSMLFVKVSQFCESCVNSYKMILEHHFKEL